MFTRLARSALVALLLAVPLTLRADAPPVEETGQEVPRPEPVWMQWSAGVLVSAQQDQHKDGGVDLGGAVGWARKRLRLGGELRYTFAGGYDSESSVYRLDMGLHLGGQLVQLGEFSVWLSTRQLFTRAGTYRREQPHVIGSYDSTERTIPYVALYGLSSTADLSLVWKGALVRISLLRTWWFAGHELSPPPAQYWVHLALGGSTL
jgi:hypothetical protein